MTTKVFCTNYMSRGTRLEVSRMLLLTYNTSKQSIYSKTLNFIIDFRCSVILQAKSAATGDLALGGDLFLIYPATIHSSLIADNFRRVRIINYHEKQ